MGVDAGLATFRGRNAAGAFPGLEQRGLQYEDICDQKWFKEEPQLAWAFWDFCHKTYQAAQPHAGYELVQQWANRMPFGAFSYTSNIDSHWLRSGWDESRLVEVHGAVRLMQCSGPCCPDAWATPDDLGLAEQDTISPTTEKLPLCPQCGAIARPGVMMFGQDTGFSRANRTVQEGGYEKWMKALEERAHKEYLNIVCLEIGCGVTVSTVRRELESVMGRFPSARLIRVNPEQPQVVLDFQDRGVGLPLGALEAVQELDRRLRAQARRSQPARRTGSRSRRVPRRPIEAPEQLPESPREAAAGSPAESADDDAAEGSSSTQAFEPRRSLRIADRVMRAKRTKKRRRGEAAEEQSSEESQDEAPESALQQRGRRSVG